MEKMNFDIYRRQNTVVQYIVTQPILELCLEAVKRPGLRVTKSWWYQEVIISIIQQRAGEEEGEEERDGEEKFRG